MVAGGITYSTVTIGSQTWTAENMKHAVTTGNAWSYDNDVNNDTNGYGKLYDWAGAMNGSTNEGAQGICAMGWHIPSDGDWKTLEGELGMSTVNQNGTGSRGTDQGTQLKAGGSSEFEARLAGFRVTDNSYFNRDSIAYWWLSTEFEVQSPSDGMCQPMAQMPCAPSLVEPFMAPAQSYSLP